MSCWKCSNVPPNVPGARPCSGSKLSDHFSSPVRTFQSHTPMRPASRASRKSLLTIGERLPCLPQFGDVRVGAEPVKDSSLSSTSGLTRVRKGRNSPSAPLSGNTMSNGSPVAMERFHRSITCGSSSGSWTLCQPQPSICSGVVPVYSYQRRLYQKMSAVRRSPSRRVAGSCPPAAAVSPRSPELRPLAVSARCRRGPPRRSSSTGHYRPSIP